MQNNLKEKQKGVISIFITTMIMLISLTMVLALAVIFVGHLKIMKDMGDSIIAFYAANTGIERLLYEYKIQGGLLPPFEIPTTSLDNGATYKAEFSIQTNREYFKSIGEFKGVRRAIQVRR